ncbi:MAG: tRNA (adenosine(37)-N6)-threonylcarbamoyltransferase complex dimerization subunit type 1 TsaB [Vampirovibrionales bacterium]|nr:tRNA (adenosine(37)-N6)-threonylcarbamoyltransferase complex dimerization subunit type 1 TsaB [Vampirovibrionales bacterium]
MTLLSQTKRSNHTLLALDTSGPTLYMGIYEKTDTAPVTLGERQVTSDSQRYHSAILMDELGELLKAAGKTLNEIDDLAIHNGPGSFTGIRTGLISARTFGQFLPITPYAINAFELILYACSSILFPAQALQVAIDARRGRIYYASGKFEQGAFAWQQSPCLLPIEALSPDYPVIASQSLLAAITDVLKDKPLAEKNRKGTEFSWEKNRHSHKLLSIEALYEKTPPSRLMAMMLLSACQQKFHPPSCSWQTLLPLYLEEPNITLPKKNPVILPVADF